jgi:hypothetical protein
MKQVCGSSKLELAQYREVDASHSFASSLKKIKRFWFCFGILLTGAGVIILHKISISSGTAVPQPGIFFKSFSHNWDYLFDGLCTSSDREALMPLGGMRRETWASFNNKTGPAGVQVSMMNNHDFDLNEQPPVEQPVPSYAAQLAAAQTHRLEQNELKAKKRSAIRNFDQIYKRYGF